VWSAASSDPYSDPPSRSSLDSVSSSFCIPSLRLPPFVALLLASVLGFGFFGPVLDSFGTIFDLASR
jgi:hypothetical protein